MADRPPPTPVAMLIGTAIIAGLSGYMIGIATSLGLLPNPFVSKPARKRGIANYDDETESEEEEVDVDDAGTLDHAPNWANGVEADKRDGLRATASGVKKGVKEQKWEGSTTDEECKLVLVVRTDLGMTKGKIAAQCGHATLACYKTLQRIDQSRLLRRWETTGQAKIALQIKSEEDMMVLQATAISLGVTAEVIADAGRTQIAAGSHTVLGIGPAPKSVVDQITGTLKLL